MKQRVLLAFLLLSTGFIYSQKSADAIIGKWLNPDRTKKMEIYKLGTEFYGKLIWMSEPTSKAKVGDLVLKDFKYDGGKWVGKVVVKGDSYSGSLKLDNNILSITATVGFLSKTKKWTRTNT